MLTWAAPAAYRELDGMHDCKPVLPEVKLLLFSQSRKSCGAFVIRVTAGFVLFFISISGLAAVQDAGDPPLDQLTIGQALMDRALNAFGPREKLIAIRSAQWKASVTQSTSQGSISFEEEGVQALPGLFCVEMVYRPEAPQKIVITSDFSYRSANGMTLAIPSVRADLYRQEMKFDPVYIAQNLSRYTFTPVGSERYKGTSVDVLKISSGGMDYFWKIDMRTGRLMSVSHHVASGDVISEFSDYRQVDGIYYPFTRHTTSPGYTTDVSLDTYKTNISVDQSLSLQPSDLSPTALKLRVLESDSISYTQDLGGDNSSNCQIAQLASNPPGSNSLDDLGFVTEPIGSNLKLTCNSWDQNSIFPRTLNAMLVASSDGNAYVIACDRTWHWSRCIPLKAGLIFPASREEDKLEVRGASVSGKEQESTYKILLEKPLQ
jgi:hypothetical protein